jgi:hypothetical protein
MTTLAQNNVWLSIMKFKRNHIICSPSYAFVATITPPTSFLLANITTMGCFKVSIVGDLTSIQFIVTTNKYFICNVALTNILDLYKFSNRCYKHVEITTPPKGVLHTFFMYFIC